MKSQSWAHPSPRQGCQTSPPTNRAIVSCWVARPEADSTTGSIGHVFPLQRLVTTKATDAQGDATPIKAVGLLEINRNFPIAAGTLLLLDLPQPEAPHDRLQRCRHTPNSSGHCAGQSGVDSSNHSRCRNAWSCSGWRLRAVPGGDSFDEDAAGAFWH